MIENQSIYTKYYKMIDESLKRRLSEIHNLNDFSKKEFIVCYDNQTIIGFLSFMNYCYLSDNFDSKLVIDIEVKDELKQQKIIERLFKKLFLINRLTAELIIIPENKYQEHLKLFKLDLVYEEGNKFLVRNPYNNLKRIVEIGDLPTGPYNNICDVKGVLVGHSTINDNDSHTGVTSILPHRGNIFRDKVVGATYAYNGYGKSVGTIQINELGTIETPILLTNTLSVGLVYDGLVEYLLEQNPEIGVSTSTVNPAVFECNDGKLNEIRSRVIKQEHVFEAINTAVKDFKQGSIGAGAGMKCHGFKGGIGSSSRLITINNHNYMLGVLVNSNFNGNRPSSLIFKNRHIGKMIDNMNQDLNPDQGSIIIVIATDLPLDSRQLERVCRRAALGVGKTGSFVSGGSGDIIVAFSTKNKVPHFPISPLIKSTFLHDDFLDLAFKATYEATEEAILNSMLFSNQIIGFKNTLCKSLNEYIDLFDDLLIDEFQYK